MKRSSYLAHALCGQSTTELVQLGHRLDLVVDFIVFWNQKDNESHLFVQFVEEIFLQSALAAVIEIQCVFRT